MIGRRRAIGLAAAMLPLRPGWAQEHPPALPLRDVDVTYTSPTPRGAVRQRLRFSAARSLMRIDPPGDDLYVVIDFGAGRMFTVRAADRSVIEMAAPRTWMHGLGTGRSTPGRYTRRNAIVVSDVSCTEWQTTDNEGRDVRICIDQDGVTIRVNLHTPAGEATLALATEIRREGQGVAVFAVPDFYRRLTPPAGAR
jgi:hypothetical protein